MRDLSFAPLHSERKFQNKPVKNSELFSKAWCDIIFNGRNQDYGAYKIRKNVGRRYSYALTLVFAGAFLAAVIPTAFTLYFRYKFYKSFKDAATEVRQLKKLEREKGYTVKHISAGRGAPSYTVIKGAAEESPDIVDFTKQDIVFGINGSETYIVDDSKVMFEDRDTLHNRNRKDLPIEGPQIVAIDVVKEMPQFPGGPTALMSWLDANIGYPQHCIDNKIEGDMEVVFYVLKNGNVGDVKITKTIDPELDRIVLKAFKRMPRWTPGKADGKFTAVQITLPLHFQTK